VEVAADLVVLAPAMVPRAGASAVAEFLDLSTDEHGWFTAAEANFQPVETGRAGVFLAGAAGGPMDIPETVAQASGAAAQVLSLFARWGSEGGQD
ncbi:MAG: disulfide reductase, partial [Chloroflexota bacterium]|nr:disulfide reductase [Chloroflexota bacterium]